MIARHRNISKKLEDSCINIFMMVAKNRKGVKSVAGISCTPLGVASVVEHWNSLSLCIRRFEIVLQGISVNTLPGFCVATF